MPQQDTLLVTARLGEWTVPGAMGAEAAQHGDRQPHAVELDPVLDHHPLLNLDLGPIVRAQASAVAHLARLVGRGGFRFLLCGRRGCRSGWELASAATETL